MRRRSKVRLEILVARDGEERGFASSLRWLFLRGSSRGATSACADHMDGRKGARCLDGKEQDQAYLLHTVWHQCNTLTAGMKGGSPRRLDLISPRDVPCHQGDV